MNYVDKYENLRKPINIGRAFIKNRIALAPMGDIYQVFDSLTGVVNQNWVDYLTERAKGDVGLLITTAMKVGDDIVPYREYGICDWVIFNKASERVYSELAQYVHAYGSRIFFQLSAGRGRVARPGAFDSEDFVPISVSDNEGVFRPDRMCRPVTVKEIEQIIKDFGEAAKIVSDCDIDGIEIHAHEGYLFDEFATSLWNKRTDRYNGTLEDRLRFAIEVLNEIKETVGSDFPVTYRYGVRHFIKEPLKSAYDMSDPEIGRNIEESIEMAKILEKAGFDGLHVDVGCYESVYWSHPPIYMAHGFSVDLLAEIKKAVNIPVIACGKLGIPDLAEGIVRDGKADMVALGRPLLADPYWPKKTFENRTEDIRPCIGCHEEMNKSETYQFTTCAVNPFCANESKLKVEPAKKKKKVLIAGGGVGGMEAASIAVQRGHEVILYEKENQLGGNVITAAAPEFKRDIQMLLDYYNTLMKKMNINIKFGTILTAEIVKQEAPDTVIVATGSTLEIPNISGANKPHVKKCTDVLKKEVTVGNKVVVVGGGIEGAEAAAWLATQGKEVTLVEMLGEIAPNLHRANRVMLLDMLEHYSVKTYTNTKVIDIKDKSVYCVNSDLQDIKIEADSVVLATGLTSSRDLYLELLKDPSFETYAIGDCSKPRKIGDAIWEGCLLALNI